jgi:hypothetical protein
MTWWKWLLIALVVAALLVGGGYHGGVTAERQRGAQRTIALLAAQGELDRAYADTVAKLEAGIVARDTSVAREKARANAAEGKAGVAARETATIRQELAVAMTAADSLAAYPPLVDALTRQVIALDSSRAGYRDALAASLQASGLLRQRLAVDSLALHDARAALAKAITVLPVTPSRGGIGRTAETAAIAATAAKACKEDLVSFGCVAGVVVVGRRLR